MDRKQFWSWASSGAGAYSLASLHTIAIIASGIQLIGHDEPKLVAILCWLGLAFGIALPLLLLPARLIRNRALDSFQMLRGPGIAIYLWLALGHLWTFTLLAVWAGVIISLGLGGAGDGAGANELAARLLLSYGVAVLPWVLFDLLLGDRRSLYFLGCDAPEPMVFLQLGSLCAIAGFWLMGDVDLCIAIIVLSIASSLCLELTEAWDRIRRGRQLLNLPVGNRVPAAKVRTIAYAAASLVAGTVSLLTLDLMTPAGVGDGFGYCFLLPLCLWLPGRYTLLATSLILTALTIFGAIIVPTSDVGLLGTLVNRSIAIMSICGVHALLSRPVLIGALMRRAAHRQIAPLNEMT